MKNLLDYILEAQKESAGAGEGSNSTYDPEDLPQYRGKNTRPYFWGAQSDKEIPWEKIYYYAVKGNNYSEEQYRKDVQKIFNMMARGKFGKYFLVRTAVDNKTNHIVVDEANVFFWDSKKKVIFNWEDNKQFYNAEEFCDDSGLWGILVMEDDMEQNGKAGATMGSTKQQDSYGNRY